MSMLLLLRVLFSREKVKKNEQSHMKTASPAAFLDRISL